MDPNANLEELLEWAEKSNSRGAELVRALDEWISGGGFLPQRWQRPNAVVQRLQCTNNAFQKREV